jgi:hypothetical protein
MQLVPQIKRQFFDSNGDPLAGGKVYSYIAGTATPQDTYTDSTGATPNSNPIILDGNGEANIWIGNLVYKFVIKDSLDNVLKTEDNVELLSDGSVTAAKIAAGAVTQAKLGAKTVTTSPITFASTSSTTAIAATGACSITTTGRPVSVRLIGEAAAGIPAFLKINANQVIPATGTIEIFRDLIKISSQSFGGVRTNSGTLRTTFTANGTMTAPESGVVYIKGCGGGGGGASGGAWTGGAAGGGGGGAASDTASLIANVTPGTTLTVTIGTGGAGGGSVGTNAAGITGTAGGTTTVVSTADGALFGCLGGAGGIGGAGGSAAAGAGGASSSLGGSGGAGGAGGASSSAGNRGIINAAFAGGSAGSSSGVNGGAGGGGGSNGFGQGATGASSGGSAGTVGSTAYGCGGAGGVGSNSSGSSGAGSAGKDGYVEIYDSYAFTGGNYDTYAVPSNFGCMDSVAAGTYSYSVKYYVSNASATMTSSGTISIQAYEL